MCKHLPEWPLSLSHSLSLTHSLSLIHTHKGMCTPIDRGAYDAAWDKHNSFVLSIHPNSDCATISIKVYDRYVEHSSMCISIFPFLNQPCVYTSMAHACAAAHQAIKT